MPIEKLTITTVHDPLTLDLIDLIDKSRTGGRGYVFDVLQNGGSFIVEKGADSHLLINYTEVPNEAEEASVL